MSDTGTTKPATNAATNGTAPGRNRLAGRRILVVGGGQQAFDAPSDPVGNGRAISMLCAREGATVAVADCNRASALETAARIASDGGRSVAVVADIGDEQDVADMFGETVSALGGIDGLVLNAAVTDGSLGLLSARAAEWDKILSVNLRGPMLCCQRALEIFAPESSIVFISSVAALRSGTMLPAYDASKAALGALMRQTAREGARCRIRANAVCPGLVDTPLGRRTSAQRPSRGASGVPLGRMGTAWEIAYAVLFLLSDESAYITAQTLAVDGGVSGI